VFDDNYFIILVHNRTTVHLFLLRMNLGERRKDNGQNRNKVIRKHLLQGRMPAEMPR